MTKYKYKDIEIELNETDDIESNSSDFLAEKTAETSERLDEKNHHDHHHHHDDNDKNNSQHHSDKINGKEIHIIKTQNGKYLSHSYPYVIFDNKLELAKTIIDYVPEYGGKEYKDKEGGDE